MTRSEFINREADVICRFITETTIKWSVTYRCPCGYVTHSSREIYDHTQTCGEQHGHKQVTAS